MNKMAGSRGKLMVELCKAPLTVNNIQENVLYDCQVINNNVVTNTFNESLLPEVTSFMDEQDVQNTNYFTTPEDNAIDFLNASNINCDFTFCSNEEMDIVVLNKDIEQHRSDVVHHIAIQNSDQYQESCHILNGHHDVPYKETGQEINLHEESAKESSTYEDAPGYQPIHNENDDDNAEESVAEINDDSYKEPEQHHLHGESDKENSSYEDDPSYQPIHNENEDDNSEESVAEINDKDDAIETKRKRKRIAEPDDWQKNKEKKLRMKGQEYIGYSRSNGIVKQCTKRPARTLKAGCSLNKFCAKTKKRNCALFTDTYRRDIFDLFWDMSWDQKHIYVINLVIYLPKKRCYVAGPSRRNGSYSYHLRLGQDRLQVCKKMFLSTLGLNEKMVHGWVLNGKEHGLVASSDVKNQQIIQKRGRSSSVKAVEDQKLHLKLFFDMLPKLDSHYCRRDSKKQYFEYQFKNKVEIYNVYMKKCEDDGRTPLSIFTFNHIFDQLNLSIYKPRKDQCEICCQYKVHQITDEEYQTHIQKKDCAREEKIRDKERANNGEIYAFTMDVQAVKLCPVLKAGNLYYKKRLQLHNFTIYNLATHHSMNYIWNETEGDLQSSSFISCVISHLENFCLSEKKPVIFISDGCGYQNRNSVLANALSYFSAKHGIEIEQKFLEKGHTQMECDSTHALIERRLDGREINLPSEYITVIREARKKPSPLEVQYITHQFFKNFDDQRIRRYESIRPGKVKNDPTVSDLRALKYLPNGNILYKISFDQQYQELPQRQKNISTNVTLHGLHKDRLPIDGLKWKHLQILKGVLPIDTHNFYDSIPHKV